MKRCVAELTEGYLKEFEDNDADAVTMFDLLGMMV